MTGSLAGRRQAVMAAGNSAGGALSCRSMRRSGQWLSECLSISGVLRKAPSRYAKTQDRRLVRTLVNVKHDAWYHFAYRDRSLPNAAAQQWEGLFSHPALPRHPRIRSGTWPPIELVQARLLPSAQVIDLAARRAAPLKVPP